MKNSRINNKMNVLEIKYSSHELAVRFHMALG